MIKLFNEGFAKGMSAYGGENTLGGRKRRRRLSIKKVR